MRISAVLQTNFFRILIKLTILSCFEQFCHIEAYNHFGEMKLDWKGEVV